MSDGPFQRLRRFLRELKRRNVYKVAVTYVAVAFVGFQAARLLIPSTVLPSWSDEFFLFFLIIGFPVAVVVAWAFEMTPEGVQRTPEAHGGAGGSSAYQWIGLTLVIALAGGVWYATAGDGEAPSARTVAPADSAMADRGTAPRLGKRSIAVLPFEPLSESEESRTFAQGVHDDLLTRLAHVSVLKVISRTAVEQYRDSELTTGAIADSLGVRWVLEGGVQVMRDQIQVNAQLIDPRTETHVWADSYQRNLTAKDLFALQSEITKRIARSLEARLTSTEREQIERQPTGDLGAYRLYVKGRSALDTRTQQGMRRAVDYFRRAISHDSTYALAWAGLADATGLFRAKGYASPEDSLPDWKAAARRALELGPKLADAHASMGFVQYNLEHDGPAALRELKRAVQLKPSYAQAHHWLGFVQLALGRPDLAREHITLALELNPEHAAAREVLVWIHVGAGELERARQQLRQFRSDYPGDLSERAWVLYHEERWDDLRRLSRKRLLRASSKYIPWGYFFLARIATLRGDSAEVRGNLADLSRRDASPARYVHQGLIRAALGEEDAAFAAWREIEEWGMETSVILRYLYPDVLGPLRDDPRYEQLIRDLNRAWGLNPDGSLPDSVDVSLEPTSDD